MMTAITWSRENLDPAMQPTASVAGYHVDTFIHSLVDRHHLSAHPGESDLSLTLRALGTEFGQIAHHAKAIARATEKTAADQNPNPGSQPRPQD